jgi:hypothetical protein
MRDQLTQRDDNRTDVPFLSRHARVYVYSPVRSGIGLNLVDHDRHLLGDRKLRRCPHSI